MVQVTFDIPERLLGRFYMAVGRVLMRPQLEGSRQEAEPQLHEWGTFGGDDDQGLGAA